MHTNINYYLCYPSIFFIFINKLLTIDKFGGEFMRNKDYLKKVYRKFSKFIETAAVRELEYFVLDAKYTKSFNKKIKKLTEEIEKDNGEGINISVMFDTDGDIVLIDGEVLGKYIGDCYSCTMCNYYKEESLNRVVREVINGSEKSQKDFVRVSYAVIYNILGGLYSEIKCRKDIMEEYKRDYGLASYYKEDLVIVIIALLIIEDICRYIGIKPDAFIECIKHIKNKQEF